MDCCRAAVTPFFDEDTDGYTLLDIEYILILVAVRGNLFFLGIAVQVEDVNIGESFHQRPAHTAEGRVIQIGMVSDKA